VADLKTKPSDADVQAFLASVPDEGRRRDAIAICALMDDHRRAAHDVGNQHRRLRPVPLPLRQRP
jgi:hypothetical protein